MGKHPISSSLRVTAECAGLILKMLATDTSKTLEQQFIRQWPFIPKETFNKFEITSILKFSLILCYRTKTYVPVNINDADHYFFYYLLNNYNQVN